MIWKTKTHEYAATLCQKTGRPCPALARLARAVTDAMSQAVPTTTPDFGFDGSAELGHCPTGCIARFRAQRDEIRIFCGSEEHTSLDRLDDYADMMFGPEYHALATDLACAPPCAMLQVTPLEPRASVRITEQVSV